ncbi:Rrf2 family transcriptional regulator [Jeongeupia sp. USM3]|uniref:RrF2 family transcriptional regulator n=1 Tax=Jeongeupia sp. USM3 TaxID=1906741 RepID=UPI00089DF181|nr:Rrf2 family transcriptional regulator [Jeongeupia sp. USM3]AOX99736.1 BadM/Rrf2 family transcriptional regulator [Jeongeupia sp. USM3]
MRLTRFSDYSLRVLMYAGLASERLVTIAELADAYAISSNHLMKVVHFLSQHGYLATQRGKGGGLRLAREPQTVNLGELVRLTETSDVLVECFDRAHSQCRIGGVCRLTRLLRDAQEAFYAELGRHTLADLLQQPAPLAQVFGIDPASITRRG